MHSEMGQVWQKFQWPKQGGEYQKEKSSERKDEHKHYMYLCVMIFQHENLID